MSSTGQLQTFGIKILIVMIQDCHATPVTHFFLVFSEQINVESAGGKVSLSAINQEKTVRLILISKNMTCRD